MKWVGVMLLFVAAAAASWMIGTSMSEAKREQERLAAEENNRPEVVQQRAFERDLDDFTQRTKALTIKLEASAAAVKEANQPGTIAAREARVEETAEAVRRGTEK